MKLFLMFCLVQYLFDFARMGFRIEENAALDEKIKKRTEEIMQPGSEYMRKIEAKTREMMKPELKYMEEINKRLGQ